jgi:hypothetical protein
MQSYALLRSVGAGRLVESPWLLFQEYLPRIQNAVGVEGSLDILHQLQFGR